MRSSIYAHRKYLKIHPICEGFGCLLEYWNMQDTFPPAKSFLMPNFSSLEGEVLVDQIPSFSFVFFCLLFLSYD